jgi:hypothetical protein
MDRLKITLAACGLGLLLTSSGCRSTRNEVPPGRPFARDGVQRKAIEFSSGGHPVNGAATANLGPANSTQPGGFGKPNPASLGLPGSSFGPPGTSGADPNMLQASSNSSMPGPSMPAPSLPAPTIPSGPAPDLAIPPISAPASGPAPNQGPGSN